MNALQKLRHRISFAFWDWLQSIKINPFDELAHGTGVEVGVWRGNHAAKLLDNPNVRNLYLVDPYEPYNEPIKSEFVKEAKTKAILRTKADILRRSFIVERSTYAAKLFSDRCLDFVYLDGDHSEQAVLDDLHAWWPKLKLGGIIGLDDYNSNIPALRGVTTGAEKFGLPVQDLGGVGLLVKI